MHLKSFVIKILLFLIITNLVVAQYYFSDNLRKDEHGFLIEDVYEVDLKTGQRVLFLEGVGSAVILSDIEKIVFLSVPEFSICIYNGRRGVIDTLSNLGSFEEVEQIHIVPPDNNIFMSLIKFDAKIVDKELKIFENTLFLLDKDTYAILDTNCFYYQIYLSFFSRDGRRIYSLIDSTYGIYFQSIDTRTGQLIDEEFSIEGYVTINAQYNSYLIDSENGYAFVGYLPENEALWHLVLCDPEKRSSSCEILLPGGIPPFAKSLTPTGDIVLQDGGIVYILDKQNGYLKQRFQFQESGNPDAESILFFLGDSLYFLPEDPAKSDATQFDNIGHADLNETQSSVFLIDMMISDVEESFQKGWIDNHGIANSLKKKLENAQKQLDKGNTNSVRNKLHAFINQIEAQKGNHVSDEAYHLLKFNAECVMQRLEE